RGAQRGACRCLPHFPEALLVPALRRLEVVIGTRIRGVEKNVEQGLPYLQGLRIHFGEAVVDELLGFYVTVEGLLRAEQPPEPRANGNDEQRGGNNGTKQQANIEAHTCPYSSTSGRTPGICLSR